MISSVREDNRLVAVDDGAVVDVVADAFGEGDALALATGAVRMLRVRSW